jgi:hypothetical protein
VAIPIFRISLTNASVLSIAYLIMSVLVEASRHLYPFRWAERAADTCDWIPSRTLEWFGLLEPMRRALLDDRITNFHVRLILGTVSVSGIFLVALSVGSVMWLGRWAIDRREKKAAT